MEKGLTLFVFCNILLLLATTSFAQSYSLSYETAGLDTWNTSKWAVSGTLDVNGNPTQANEQRNETSLPFSFEFYGKSYSSVFVSSNYFLSFVDIGVGEEVLITEANFRLYKMISPLWVDGSSQSIVYVNEYSDRVVFTWDGQVGSTTKVQAVLYKNGDIRIRYGDVNLGGKTTVVGISAGDNVNYVHNNYGSNAQTAYFKYVPPSAAAPTVAVAKLAPQIINFTATPNITKRSQTVEFLFTIGDDLSVDKNAVSVSLVPKEGQRTLIGRPTLRSGDEKTGVYNLTWKVPNNFTGGVYDVTVFVCDHAGNCNTAAKAGNLTINATLYFNLNEAIKEAYNQTEEIKLSGEVVDFSNKRVKANVTLDLVYPGGKYTFKNQTEFGRYVLNYRTSLLDALGNWTIDLKATDTDGNDGNLVKKIQLKQPQAFFYYNLVYLSPINDSTYYRGENVRVSVKILDIDKLVGEADVSLKLPTGQLISMSELSPGTGVYQTTYRVKFSDQVGDWVIGAEGLKLSEGSLFAGSKSIKINVRPVDLIIDVISPTKTRFAVGDSANIKVRLSYPDNSAASGISVNATPVKKSLALVETQSGIYEASYKFTRADTGRYSLRVFAIDPYDNFGFVEKSINIVQPNLLDLFVQLWYITIPGIGLVGYTILHAKLPSILLRHYRNKLKSLEELKKSTQDKYFVEDAIDEPTFKKLTQDADRKIVEVKTKIRKQEEMLSRKGKKEQKVQVFHIQDLISGNRQKIERIAPKAGKEPARSEMKEKFKNWYQEWAKPKKATKSKPQRKDKYEQEYKELAKRKTEKK